MKSILGWLISVTAINPDSTLWFFLFPRKARDRNRRAKAHIAALHTELGVARDVLAERKLRLKRLLDEHEAIVSAYHRLLNPNEPFYSWQRDWQDTARTVLKLPNDASVEDINAALLLRDHKGYEVHE